MSDYWTHLVTLGTINAIAAWGLSLSMRGGLISAGHAAFAGMAGYAAGLAAAEGLPLIGTLVVGFVVAAAIGGLFALATLRMEHLFFAVATLALGEALGIGVRQFDQLGRAAGLTGIPLRTNLTWTVSILAVCLLVELFVLRGSRLEFALLLGNEDRRLVALTGHNWQRVRVQMFAISAGVAGIAGALYAQLFAVMQPQDLQFARSLDYLVFAVVGGVFSGYGPMVAAVGLTILPEVIEIPFLTQLITYGLILLVVMLVRPDGLFPRRAVRLGTTTTAGDERPALSDPDPPVAAEKADTNGRQTVEEN